MQNNPKIPPLKSGDKGGIWSLLNIFKESYFGMLEHKVPRMGAALAYYAVFSLAPLIMLLLSALTLFMQKDEASKQIVAQVSEVLGIQGGTAVQSILENAGGTTVLSWSTAISLLVLVVSASGAFGEIQDSLNTIWNVPKQQHPWMGMLRDRFLSVAMVFVVGFFMVVSLVLSAFLNAITAQWNSGILAIESDTLNSLCLLLIVAGFFCTIYKVLPDKEITWLHVLPGGFVAATLFVIGKSLLFFYVAHSSFSRYGAAASLMIILF